jgi:hypothetical protein
MKIFSIGNNKKLGKKVATFNLPSKVTCPGRTKECELICYAKKAEQCYKTALDSRKRNLKESKKKTFVSSALKELEKITMVRVHESGDFYNQEYLDKWKEIWTNCPDTKFLAFTKSFHLDFGELPENVSIYCSIDSTTIKTPLEGLPKALTVMKRENVPNGYRYCWPIGKKEDGTKDLNHYHICGDKCMLCWDNKVDVAWSKH